MFQVAYVLKLQVKFLYN